MSPQDLAPGTLFAADFLIVARLHAGERGATYLARHVPTGVERALKVVAPPVPLDAADRLAFEREARAGAQVESDHVALVVGAGVDATTGVAWVASERLEGSDL